ncbi:regulator of protease activity HflC (stomatin/prohibitin superfamily) [Algisphaera agarilytica]|uniref:Regulator of protease activity HflC (Stomatin/prohibitin superfamily) n=2 Tax=Algisphaera agarilytica TaxID=1385975 RepID=A0A7X0LJT2_9BACT|nr:regulator of protease activity HflC (stomatin/prohibitin superfamily) [Algisphaera agarilytica]
MHPALQKTAPIVLILVLLLIGVSRCIKIIPAGHVGVATLFGSVDDEAYEAGFHIVNPLLGWSLYDTRQQSHYETSNVPSQDQQNTEVDISVQYRVIGTMAPSMLENTGSKEKAIEVHLVPNLRSLIRESGKTIQRAEDFFNDTTHQRLETDMTESLRQTLGPKGIEVEEVLIRDFRLPSVILRQVEQKKVKEQEAEREKAELERITIESQQKVVQAKAEREAAQEEAERRKLIADAQAYEIQKINEAISANPAYIQLQSLEALKSMSKDPAAKIYFLNGDSPAPLPLLNLGEGNNALNK